MTLPLKHIIVGSSIYLAAIITSIVLLPGVGIWSTTTALLAILLVTGSFYFSTGQYDSCGWWTLTITATMLAVGIIANIHYFTTISGGTTAYPVLQNPDSAHYYADALATAGDAAGVPASANRHGYGVIISWLWHITGITIVAPIILNMLFTLLSIAICGIISRRILAPYTNFSPRQITSCAMIMAASVCYYLNSGTLLLKESGLCFAIVLCLLSLTSHFNRPTNTKSEFLFWIYFITGISLLIFLRHSFILFIALAILITMPWNKYGIINSSAKLAICIVAWTCAGLVMNGFDITRQATDIVTGTHISDSYFYDLPQHATYNNMVGDYFSYSIAERIAWLPISAVTQFLTPFPWNFCRDTIYGYTLAYAHISYPWYAVAGLVVFFLFYRCKQSPCALRRITYAGITLWFIPAYLFAGTVSRYTLPLLPLLIPAAVYVWFQYRHLRAFKTWVIIYALAMCATLIICYFLQQKGIQ